MFSLNGEEAGYCTFDTIVCAVQVSLFGAGPRRHPHEPHSTPKQVRLPFGDYWYAVRGKGKSEEGEGEENVSQ